jgi:hypothetical protein
MFCCGVVQAAAMAKAMAAKAAEEAAAKAAAKAAEEAAVVKAKAAKAAEEAAARAAEEAAVAKAQVAREKVSCTCVRCVWRLCPAQLLLLLLLLCHGVLILSCCDVPLSRCLCGVLLSLKMLTSVHVTCCFAHTAFVMVQWRIFFEMACFEYVSVVDTGTAAGAREGE